MSLTLDEIQNFKGKYPRQIWSLFFSEMWERFCFYGMRGMLVFFMISQLNFHEKEANLQYGATRHSYMPLLSLAVFSLIRFSDSENPSFGVDF